jgi:hypothetical protein
LEELRPRTFVPHIHATQSREWQGRHPGQNVRPSCANWLSSSNEPIHAPRSQRRQNLSELLRQFHKLFDLLTADRLEHAPAVPDAIYWEQTL